MHNSPSLCSVRRANPDLYSRVVTLAWRNRRSLVSVAVVVAARNEELHIEQCLRSLLEQDYPHTKYTITVVDDQSTDRTADIVKQMASENSAVDLLQLHGHPSGISPIINAINEAIKKTSSELILRTDADCVVGPHWISSMVRHFDEAVGVISGLTLIREHAKHFVHFIRISIDRFVLTDSVRSRCNRDERSHKLQRQQHGVPKVSVSMTSEVLGQWPQ